LALLLSPELWSPSRPTLPGPKSRRPHEIKSPLGVRDLHSYSLLLFLFSFFCFCRFPNPKFQIGNQYCPNISLAISAAYTGRRRQSCRRCENSSIKIGFSRRDRYSKAVGFCGDSALTPRFSEGG